MIKNTALIFGNSKYLHLNDLDNPVNDAEDISEVLKKSGFEVTCLVDAGYIDMRMALRDFQDSSAGYDGVSVFFFAGHGIEVEGKNYLMSKDTPCQRKQDVETMSLPLDDVIRRMEAEEEFIRTSIIILDACRETPNALKTRGISKGLAPVYAPRGTLIAFSTSPGQVAGDGTGQRNGLYTDALLKHIEEPDLPIEMMFKRVRNSLGAKTHQQQISWEHTSLSGEFYFNLSTSRRITSYSASAINDKTFTLDDSAWTHKAIRSLKISDWYTQNPVIEKITTKMINGAKVNNLFVLGRNILQAAQGRSNEAILFINDFKNRTEQCSHEKRKPLLDGILFEIFFDSMGKIRTTPKSKMFNSIFELEIYPDFKESFEFLLDCLRPYAKNFYRIPGSGQEVSVDIELDDSHRITHVYIDGADRLKEIEDIDEDDYEAIKISELKKSLSDQILVPISRIKIHFTSLKPTKNIVYISFMAAFSRP